MMLHLEKESNSKNVCVAHKDKSAVSFCLQDYLKKKKDIYLFQTKHFLNKDAQKLERFVLNMTIYPVLILHE